MEIDYFSQSYFMIHNKPYKSSRSYIVSVLPTEYLSTKLIVYRSKNFNGDWCYDCCFDFEFKLMMLNTKYKNTFNKQKLLNTPI